MIKKVRIRNFKKFERLEFDLPDHIVIASPNNAGKTTVLQAISTWFEIANHWVEHQDQSGRDENDEYPYVALNLLSFHSIPAREFDQLWWSKNVQDPASIEIHTDSWRVKFEILYEQMEMARVRPSRDVEDSDLGSMTNELLAENKLTSILITPITGLDNEETTYNQSFIDRQLANVQSGSVLRNLIHLASEDDETWKELQNTVKSFFGYELIRPSAPGPLLSIGFQHSSKDKIYELSSAASGFLQVLLVYTTLLVRKSTVILVDEPDAHLHVLLQKKLYEHLRRTARKNKSQLIIATHSEQLINTAKLADLRVLGTDVQIVKKRQSLVGIMDLENLDILLAATEPGLLFVEGRTDIPILREWARILSHPLLEFLEKPFSIEISEESKRPEQHFEALKMYTPNIRAVELRDGDGRGSQGSQEAPAGMLKLLWRNYEIESYLLHATSILRYLESNAEVKRVKQTREYLGNELPPMVRDGPHKDSNYLIEIKAKKVLQELFQVAGLPYNLEIAIELAAQMREEEIHPEVIKKLDTVNDHFTKT